MSRPDPDKIWQALLADEGFTAENTPASLAAISRFVRELPDALAEHHDRPLTFASLLDAKIAVIRHLLSGDHAERLVDAMMEGRDGLITKDDVMEMLTGSLPGLIEAIEEIAKDAPGFLESQGITEEQMLEHAKGGRFNTAAMEAYRSGTLTVGKLFELDPAAIIRNGNG